MSWETDFDDESEFNIQRDRAENKLPRAYPVFYDRLFNAVLRGGECQPVERSITPGLYTQIAIKQAVRSMYYNAYGLTLDFYGS